MISVMPVPLLSARPRGCSPRGRIRYVPSAIFTKSSLLANPINGVSKQCTAVPTRAKTCWGAGRQWRPQNAMHFEALDRAGRRDHPKPFNNFREIGCAPAELNINLSSESESGIFGFTAFRKIRFFLISVDRHLAKVSAHILYPKLRHPRLYQAEFFFIYEEFDLYRSLAIPVVWHLDSSLLLRIISNQNRSIIDMQFCVRLQSHA